MFDFLPLSSRAAPAGAFQPPTHRDRIEDALDTLDPGQSQQAL
jgi:hypothetical protein